MEDIRDGLLDLVADQIEVGVYHEVASDRAVSARRGLDWTGPGQNLANFTIVKVSPSAQVAIQRVGTNLAGLLVEIYTAVTRPDLPDTRR